MMMQVKMYGRRKRGRKQTQSSGPNNNKMDGIIIRGPNVVGVKSRGLENVR